MISPIDQLKVCPERTASPPQSLWTGYFPARLTTDPGIQGEDRRTAYRPDIFPPPKMHQAPVHRGPEPVYIHIHEWCSEDALVTPFPFSKSPCRAEARCHSRRSSIVDRHCTSLMFNIATPLLNSVLSNQRDNSRRVQNQYHQYPSSNDIHGNRFNDRRTHQLEDRISLVYGLGRGRCFRVPDFAPQCEEAWAQGEC